MSVKQNETETETNENEQTAISRRALGEFSQQRESQLQLTPVHKTAKVSGMSSLHHRSAVQQQLLFVF
ncbi:hypothetical protein V5799_014086 [Amblyomma americanum]|uniref:Uncharacterized protein n=1 Tax=Amblyomma americanum TaxID=6943 RepID=A0AAQ4E421_AMBAM